MARDARENGVAGEASAWVGRFLGGVRAGGRVLDVACGRGRHLRLAQACGYRVTGVDRDLSGVADLHGAYGVELVEMDMEVGATAPLSGRFGSGTFDGVIVTNYLWRPVLADIVGMVRPDGVLIYETFALGNERVGRGKPSNPDFLLKPGELLEVVRPHLTAFAYEHVTLGSGEAGRGQPVGVVQRIVAVGAEHPWFAAPPQWPRTLGQYVPL